MEAERDVAVNSCGGGRRCVGERGGYGAAHDDACTTYDTAERGESHTPNTTPPELAQQSQELPAPVSAYEEPLRVVSGSGVTGFEVMDASRRIICLEAPVHEMRRVLRAVAQAAEEAHVDGLTRQGVGEECEEAEAHGHSAKATPDGVALGTSQTLDVLFNSELFVPMRLYTSFPPLVTPPEPRPVVTEAAPAASRERKTVLSAARRGRGGGAGRRRAGVIGIRATHDGLRLRSQEPK